MGVVVTKMIWNNEVELISIRPVMLPTLHVISQPSASYHYSPDVSSSFSCIRRRAASIISSRLRCSISCRFSLSAAQPVAGGDCSFSFPFKLIRDWRL